MIKKVLSSIAVLIIIFIGCTLPTSETVNDREAFYDVITVESFREDACIGLKWRRDRGADRYIVMRSIDGLYGPEAFVAIYKGEELSYTDTDVEADIRYIYRLDKEYNGKVVYGQEVSLGVGTRGEFDLYEPNNGKDMATVLNGTRSGMIYYFRYSDGRVLGDTDWYKVYTGKGKGANLRIEEDTVGEGETGSFYITIAGKSPLEVKNKTKIRIDSEKSGDGYIYFGIYPKVEEFVVSEAAGGSIRSYRVILDSVTNNNDDNNDNDGNNGDGNNGDGNNGDNGNSNGNNGGDETDFGQIIEFSELFTPSSGGWITFLTNEVKYKNKNYTFWHRLSTQEDEFSDIEIALVKESGSSVGGYGFFFRGEAISGYGECMLTVLIQTSGNYAIGKVIDGNYQVIQAWKSGSSLRKGYGVSNVVKVSWDKMTNEYVLYINNQESDRFVDEGAPLCSGNGRGIVAVTTWQENFPVTPVKVRYN